MKMWDIQMIVTVRSRLGTKMITIDPTLNMSERGFTNFIMWIHSLVDTILPISTFRWIITFCNSLDTFFNQNNPLIDQYLPRFCGGLPLKIYFLALGENVGLRLFRNVKLIGNFLAHSFLKKMWVGNLKVLPNGDFTFFNDFTKTWKFFKGLIIKFSEFCIQVYIIVWPKKTIKIPYEAVRIYLLVSL